MALLVQKVVDLLVIYLLYWLLDLLVIYLLYWYSIYW